MSLFQYYFQSMTSISLLLQVTQKHFHWSKSSRIRPPDGLLIPPGHNPWFLLSTWKSRRTHTCLREDFSHCARENSTNHLVGSKVSHRPVENSTCSHKPHFFSLFTLFLLVFIKSSFLFLYQRHHFLGCFSTSRNNTLLTLILVITVL